MKTATELFEETLRWLRRNYVRFRFFAERDVVWTAQVRLIEAIEQEQLPFRVFNEYPMLAGKRRSLSAELAILGQDSLVELAAEFKYEPAHSRDDIQRQKFPVVFWGRNGVGKDVERVQAFVETGRAEVAYAVFIDEGGYFRKRPPHPGSEWVDWGNGVWVLLSHAVVNLDFT